MREAGRRNAEIERAAPASPAQMINSGLEQQRVLKEKEGEEEEREGGRERKDKR